MNKLIIGTIVNDIINELSNSNDVINGFVNNKHLIEIGKQRTLNEFKKRFNKRMRLLDAIPQYSQEVDSTTSGYIFDDLQYEVIE